MGNQGAVGRYEVEAAAVVSRCGGNGGMVVKQTNLIGRGDVGKVGDGDNHICFTLWSLLIGTCS